MCGTIRPTKPIGPHAACVAARSALRGQRQILLDLLDAGGLDIDDGLLRARLNTDAHGRARHDLGRETHVRHVHDRVGRAIGRHERRDPKRGGELSRRQSDLHPISRNNMSHQVDHQFTGCDDDVLVAVQLHGMS